MISKNLGRFLKDKSSSGVFYIGHASALVRMNGKLFTFDPVWDYLPYGESWKFIPEQANLEKFIPYIDGNFISHIHEDHICERILKQMECKTFIMDGRPNLRERLARSCKVMEKPRLKWVPIADGVEAYFVPHPFNTIDSSVFLRSGNFCVYVGSDNFLDSGLLATIKHDVRRVDIAMVPYAFIHWYPFLLKNINFAERLKEIRRLSLQSLNQAGAFRAVMRPRFTIPFGASLFYNDHADHILNAHLSNPWHFKNALTAIGGDYVMSDGRVSTLHTLGDYNAMLRKGLGTTGKPPLNFNFKGEAYELERIRRKVSKFPVDGFVHNHELIINNVVIDLESYEVSLRDEPGTKPFTRFNFTKRVFDQWVLGYITFEQAIGTRQFECIREPNEYRIKVFELMNNFL